jgi:hypothetical protein
LIRTAHIICNRVLYPMELVNRKSACHVVNLRDILPKNKKLERETYRE